MSSNIKTGHNIGISIKQEGTPTLVTFVGSPILGTAKQGDLSTGAWTTGDILAKARLLHGSPSITYPVDNDPQETIELGTRTIQKWTGAEKIDGKIERWMIDSDLLGAVRGKGDYSVSGTNKYQRADEFTKFTISIYHMTDSALIKETTGEFAPATGYGYKVTLTGVTLGNYDAPSEANARQKESVSYSAETMTIEALTGSV